uniref:F-box protein 40 n=1 Tax=Scleropages formosus TaxID=113540 RepID=A0A8C9RBP6_SCLFO
MSLHRHCEVCFKAHCKVPVEISVSCVTICCRLLCGAVFHQCKESEHQFLCPNETVPCLNVNYGCPLVLPRHLLAQHLESCPASIVICSLEWNRWPAGEADTAFYKNVVQSQSSRNNLDLSMALRDQRLLFQSLKMDSLFPELVKKAKKPPPCGSQGITGTLGDPVEGNFLLRQEPKDFALASAEMVELTQEEREAIAKSKEVTGISSYTAWESIFNKELQGCKQSSNNQGLNQEGSLAPWQDGVLERLGKEVNIAEYNMYLVHHGSMLIRFGQLAACTPKERDFVYGSLEPIEVQSLHTFSVPTSYKAKRSHLRDPSTRVKTVSKAVDTSDLGITVEELPKWDEVQATLLCSLEKELKGHPICETVATDGLFVDLGTQTYDFSSAPFEAGTTLAEVTANRQLELHVQIQAESVTQRYNKSNSTFTFLCGHTLRRDEFAKHFRNAHSDVQSGLNGWFEQRCPLAYLGCNYSQKRFQPSTHKATVTYDEDLGAFAIRPEVPSNLLEGVKIISPESKHVQSLDPLSRLPFEVLQHIAGFLDSFTLFRLSQVSRLMRDVCGSLLRERGMVSLKWEKKISSHGEWTWESRRKVWQFSTLSSAVDQWSFTNMPTMAEHLKTCPFYEKQERSKPVALPSMHDDTEDGVERQCLVTMFVGHN